MTKKPKRTAMRNAKPAENPKVVVRRLEKLAEDLEHATAEADALAETVRDQLAHEASIHTSSNDQPRNPKANRESRVARRNG